MDQHTLNPEVFFKSLTEEESDTCGSDEKRLGEIFEAGWSEETSVRFARAMFHARRVNPEANVDGVFETALRLGLMEISERFSRGQSREVKAAPAKKRGRLAVRGV